MNHLTPTNIFVGVGGLLALGYAIATSEVGIAIVVVYGVMLEIRRRHPGSCPSCRAHTLRWVAWDGKGRQVMSMFRAWNHFRCENCRRTWKSRVIGMHPVDDRVFAVQPADAELPDVTDSSPQ
jgi:hypothetical protein